MEPVRVGEYNTLKVNRKVDFGFYLDDGGEGILLPKRFAPRTLRIGDELEVFVYHDSDNRLIATTQKAKATVGEIVKMKAVSVTNPNRSAVCEKALNISLNYILTK
jgi:predicted RNA-binding protein (virulence factor B family)